VPAEEIAARAARALAVELDAGAGLDVHAVDQLLVYLALAGRSSRFLARDYSSHARTTAWLLGQFLPVHITATPVDGLMRIEVARD
jgi:RNA 3'-terminal phosphate cyclase